MWYENRGDVGNDAEDVEYGDIRGASGVGWRMASA